MTHYDPKWVRTYYDQYAEKEWQRWDRSPVQRIKLEVHLHYLRQAIQPGDRVLEIGAASGRFTQELARITEGIVVADLSPVQLELNRQNGQGLGFSGRSVGERRFLLHQRRRENPAKHMADSDNRAG